MTEDWTLPASGALREEPLLLQANRAGAFGTSELYEGGGVHKALFTYLCGDPNKGLFNARPDLFFGSWLVCVSAAWESFIREKPCERVMRRVMMKPRRGASIKTLTPLPPGYALSRFTPEVFAAHPFEHGANYRDYEDFMRRGSGMVVLREGSVAAASSFLSFGSDVELDVFTAPEHRGKGLADHCVAAVMDDCAARGLAVHWDAQNDMSAAMAQSHGFAVAQEYAVYVLKS